MQYYHPTSHHAYSISTRLRYHVVLPPTSSQAIPSASSCCIMQSYQPTSKQTIPPAKWVAAMQYYHPTCTLAAPSLHGLDIMHSYKPTSYHAVPSPHGIGITQSYQPTSYHAVPSIYGLGIMQSYQPTSKHANSIMQYVLSPYIQSCSSIPPRYPVSPQNMQLSNKPTNRSNAAPAVRSKNTACVSWRVLFAYSVADQSKLPCALYFMPQSVHVGVSWRYQTTTALLPILSRICHLLSAFCVLFC